MRWLNGITDSMDISLSKRREILKDGEAWNATVHGVAKNWTTEWLSSEELMFLNYGAGERCLRVPWTVRRSNQSILKEINPEYSLEELMMRLKLQYLGHLMQRASSLENILILGKTEGRRRRE